MSEKIAVIEFEGKRIELPILESSMGEKVLDISKLRQETGLVTYDPGFKNTTACKSSITHLDGEKGELMYRGYRIEDLIEASFLDVSHLLIFSKFPDEQESKKFEETVRKYTLINEEMKEIIDGFPKTAHPMGILSSLTSALTGFNPKSVDINSKEALYHASAKTMASFSILASWVYRKERGYPLNYYDNTKGYVYNFLRMLFELPTEPYEPSSLSIEVLNRLLILHADHEQNCSTSTIRIVGSSHAGLFASISAGVSSLWGPLHGGANQAVIEMLKAMMEDGGNIDKYIKKAKDKNDPYRLMGFGHRIYKNFDPRARVIKKMAYELLDELSLNAPLFDLARNLEEKVLADSYFIERKLYPNVDFYSGIIYTALGIPTAMFPVLFALGRLPGWIAHWKEMRVNKEPIVRPRQMYVGHTRRKL